MRGRCFKLMPQRMTRTWPEAATSASAPAASTHHLLEEAGSYTKPKDSLCSSNCTGPRCRCATRRSQLRSTRLLPQNITATLPQPASAACAATASNSSASLGRPSWWCTCPCGTAQLLACRDLPGGRGSASFASGPGPAECSGSGGGATGSDCSYAADDQSMPPGAGLSNGPARLGNGAPGGTNEFEMTLSERSGACVPRAGLGMRRGEEVDVLPPCSKRTWCARTDAALGAKLLVLRFAALYASALRGGAALARGLGAGGLSSKLSVRVCTPASVVGCAPPACRPKTALTIMDGNPKSIVSSWSSGCVSLANDVALVCAAAESGAVSPASTTLCALCCAVLPLGYSDSERDVLARCRSGAADGRAAARACHDVSPSRLPVLSVLSVRSISCVLHRGRMLRAERKRPERKRLEAAVWLAWLVSTPPDSTLACEGLSKALSMAAGLVLGAIVLLVREAASAAMGAVLVAAGSCGLGAPVRWMSSCNHT